MRTMEKTQKTTRILSIDVRKAGSVVILEMAGRATIGDGNNALANELRRQLDAGNKQLIVDLSGVTQIDSSGIATLVRAYASFDRNGGKLKLLHLGGHVLEIFMVTRLIDAIPVFQDEAAALASFQ